MAETFERAIIEAAEGRGNRWKVLQPPTGSGKTEGACLYAALQARLNEAHYGSLDPVGILIVTRLIDQANTLASRINELTGKRIACALHSKSKATADEITEAHALVVTHRAFVDAAGNTGGSSWRKLTAWKGGDRLLTIIDEALANVVDENKVTLQNLNFVIGCVPQRVAESFPEQIRYLECLRSVLQRQASALDGCDQSSIRLLWEDGNSWQGDTLCTNTRGLRDAMRATPYDLIITGSENKSQRARVSERVDRTLENAQAIAERWSFYARSGEEHSLNSAALLVPESVPGAVVLDATANQNFLWELLQNRAEIVPIRSGARRYNAVNLHVARARGVGKTSMEKNFALRYPRLLKALEGRLGPERSVLLCTHKAHEHVPATFEHGFKRLEVAHWGAVDGRNDWKDFDAAVIFGLPYLDRDTWGTNLFFALQGVRDDQWLRAPSWMGYSNVRAVMQQRQLSVSIIQAINRIRCRKVTDTGGGCAPCDVFVVLPSDKDGDAILDDIRSDMVGINVIPWDFELDGPKVRRARKGSSHEALLALMKNRDSGETPLSLVQRELGLKPKGLEKLKAVLRDETHQTTRALAEIGVKLVTTGRTRAAKSYLVKHQAA